nr:retrovirus-related Pol polyprotein from transposon TNT 1-94 [Tanacetum cinerariifolium]
MEACQKKPEVQWSADERKAANLDQRLKSLIVSLLPDDQMNFVINCLIDKSTWDELILYHNGPSDVKESRDMDLKLCYSTFKFKEEHVSSDDNKVIEVNTLMVLTEEERVLVNKERARNREWVQISIRKRRILGVGQLTEDPSSSWLKDLVFIKSSVDNTKASIPGVERPWLSEAKGFILPNHDTGRILPSECQRNLTDHPIAVIDLSKTEYDSADESLVCSTFFPPLEKPGDVETIAEPKAVKTTLNSICTFKSEALKYIIPNEPSSAPG